MASPRSGSAAPAGSKNRMLAMPGAAPLASRLDVVQGTSKKSASKIFLATTHFRRLISFRSMAAHEVLELLPYSSGSGFSR